MPTYAIDHMSHYGTHFRCVSSNLSAPILVRNDRAENGALGMHPATFACEVAEFIGWYALEVWPGLIGEGFAGFDALSFHFEDEKAKNVPVGGSK